MKEVLVFTVEDQQFALDLSCLERVIWAVEITPVPNESDNIAGIINVHGTIIPVINVRKLLGREERAIILSDQLIVCAINGKKCALWVDDVHGVASYEEKNFIPAAEVFPKEHLIDYVIKNEESIILVYNWGKLNVDYEALHAQKGC